MVDERQVAAEARRFPVDNNLGAVLKQRLHASIIAWFYGLIPVGEQ
jgi:hypothetical protein